MRTLLALLFAALLAVAPAWADTTPAPQIRTVGGKKPTNGDVPLVAGDVGALQCIGTCVSWPTFLAQLQVLIPAASAIDVRTSISDAPNGADYVELQSGTIRSGGPLAAMVQGHYSLTGGQIAAVFQAAGAVRSPLQPYALPTLAQIGAAAVDLSNVVGPHTWAAQQTFTLPVIAPNTCVDIKSKGGVTDGVTDDTAALLAAVAAGSCVHVPAGQTAICNPVITKSNLTIIGDASQGSVFVPASPTCSGLQFGTSSVGVTDDFVRSVGYIAPARQPSGTFALNFLNTFHSGWEDVYIKNAYDGIVLSGGIYGNGAALRSTTHDVIQINGGNDRYITKVVADSEDGIPAHAGVAIYASAGSDVIVDNDFIHTGTGLLIAPTGGAHVEWPFLQNDAFDSCSDTPSTRGPAISISPSGAGSYVRGGTFTQMWASTCAQGLVVNPTGGAYVDNILFQGLRAFNNDQDGVLLDGGSDIEFDGALVNTNSKLNPGVFAGINVQAAVGDVRIIGGSFGKNASEAHSNQLRGVIFQPGYAANATVIGARFCGYYPGGNGLFLGTGGAGVNYQHGFNVCE